MRCSLRLNNDLTPDAYVALARAAERHGFDQLWISNDLFLRSAPVLLPPQHPGATDRTEASILNGISYPSPHDPSAELRCSPQADRAVRRRFNSGLAQAPALLVLDRIEIRGRPRRCARPSSDSACSGAAVTAGRFVRDPEASYLRFTGGWRVTPIYLGAITAAMLGLAGELARRRIALLFPPGHWLSAAPSRRGSPSCRRRPVAAGTSTWRACLWVSLADDERAARRALAEKIASRQRAGPLIFRPSGRRALRLRPDRAWRSRSTATCTAPARLLTAHVRIGWHRAPARWSYACRPLVAAGVRTFHSPHRSRRPLRAPSTSGREVCLPPALRRCCTGRRLDLRDNSPVARSVRPLAAWRRPLLEFFIDVLLFWSLSVRGSFRHSSSSRRNSEARGEQWLKGQPKIKLQWDGLAPPG